MKNWKRLTGEKLENIKDTILADVAKYPDKEIKFYVGCDSQLIKHKIIYVTAIVLYRQGNGGLAYYFKEHEEKVHDRTRLWNETFKAVNCALWLNELLKQVDLIVVEVHADLNHDEKHMSNTMVQACLGYICSMGFEGKIKPWSWVSTKVANSKTKSAH